MVRAPREGQKGLALIMALLICGAISTFHGHEQSSRGTDPVSGAVRDAALVPAESMGVRTGHWWKRSVVSLFSGPRLARQNDTLQAQVVELSAENRQLLSAQQENDRLRRLLDFQQRSAVPLVAAEVTALKPSSTSDTLTINRGASSGVHVHSIVISQGGGLVGQVLDVSSESATVLMLTDITSSVGAEVTSGEPGSPVGICKGQGGALRLTYLKGDADVKAGDKVVTSGLGSLFPTDLPVGTIRSVVLDQARSLKVAVVKPAADLDHLTDVFVIR